MLLLWLLPRPGAGEDRVIVRGNYYREASTRVLQPTVDVEVDVPDERLSLGTAYVLDAISSASIASGAAEVTGGDQVFTEIRHEVLGRASSRLGDWGLGGFFRYSTETDYISRSAGASASRDLLQRSLTLSLAYAYNFDRVSRIQMNTMVVLPWCGGSVDIALCQPTGHGARTNLRQVHYVSGGYAHAWHETLLGLASVEVARTLGPQDNPYRGAQIPTSEVEIHPLQRTQVALTGGARWMIPRSPVVLEPRYRFTTDSWLIKSHAIDTRVHVRALPHLRLRARYRYYRQSASFICLDSPGDDLDDGSQFFCSTTEGEFATADPKLGAWHSHTPGVQVVFELDALAGIRYLDWLENGWVEATYNHVFQSNRYGNARLGALAFSLAF
ncbi:DUF3570 domain-containing protein [Paraliomyxa miuraensis]|uniref:DUF3570 domain-containing protein n=1 Tax=Paraliomyxa miuraensis TaxID=376150 RepID=UPI002252DB64|nr:DUF3570 domain-containing protein [Paraliomyxa miuraensis]MCX4245798.1 DUF3570 domain-containing protein [Paraliomyxa miuraensis]